jgi:hypothetical protein
MLGVRAHGQAQVWTTNRTLAEESSPALCAIDLHFHDPS